MTEQFTFFWGGPFSQWAKAQFTDDRGITYNCAEQFMMAHKALLFGDNIRYGGIMSTSDPKLQKIHGRKVLNFDADQWNKVARQIVIQGNLLKFSQNPEFKAALMKTAGTTLVEASPYDKIWGIGLRENDPRAQNRETWQGTNWLGEALTEVRERLKLSPITEVVYTDRGVEPGL